MPWWRQIKPGSCQGIIGYEDTPAEIAGKILKELGLENEKAASIEDHDGGSHSRAAVDQPARSEQSIIKYDGDGQTIV